jgi:hypothetical protein
MVSPMRRGGRWSIMVLAGVLAAWIVPGQSAFARGGGHGGGHWGGGFGGGGHWGGGPHFRGYPYHGLGYGSGYGTYIDPGWMGNSGYPGPTDGYGYGTAYGFPFGIFGSGSPYPYPDWRSGVIRRAPRHRGLRSVGVAPAVAPATSTGSSTKLRPTAS